MLHSTKELTSKEIWEKIQEKSIRLDECQDEYSMTGESGNKNEGLWIECTQIIHDIDDLKRQLHARKVRPLKFERSDTTGEDTYTLLYPEDDESSDDVSVEDDEDNEDGGDCAARALSALTGVDYSTALRDLNEANAGFGHSSISKEGILPLAAQKAFAKYGLDLRTPMYAYGAPARVPKDYAILSPKRAHDIYGDAILATGPLATPDEAEANHVQAVVQGKVVDAWDTSQDRVVTGVFTPTDETPKIVKQKRLELRKFSPDWGSLRRDVQELQSVKTSADTDPAELARIESDRASLSAHYEVLPKSDEHRRDAINKVTNEIKARRTRAPNEYESSNSKEYQTGTSGMRERRRSRGNRRPRGKLT